MVGAPDTSRSTTALRWLLVGLLLWAPLPIGSNRPWSWTLLALAVGILLLAWFGAELRWPRIRSVPAPVWIAGALIGGTLGWAWIQTLPSVRLGHPVWTWAVDYDAAVQPYPSVDPLAGREALLRLLSYVGVFWLSFALAREGGAARRLLRAILMIVAAYAIWGLTLYFGVARWFGDVRSSALTSTFVNRNHAATYLAIGAVIAVALLGERLRSYLAKPGGRAVLAALGQLIERDAPLVLTTLCLVLALLLTGSRGGLLALGAGVITVFCFAFAGAALGMRARALIAGLVAAAALGLLRLGGGATLERLAQLDQEFTLAGANRLTLWQNCLDLIRERPLTGHGYGTFEQLFHLTRDAGFELVWHTAHNTYLEHAVELGVPATLALYAGMLLLVGHCARGALRRRRDRVLPTAAVGASVVVGSHALVDFGLQIPAVAITYAAVMGIGCAQAIPSASR